MNPISNLRCSSWSDFAEHLGRYFELSFLDRRRFLFRGQADSNWTLRTTLARYVEDGDSRSPSSVRRALLSQFQSESVGLPGSQELFGERGLQAELIARHHQLPSPIIDWTRSPYVAAFFAYSDPLLIRPFCPEEIAVWVFDTNALADERTPTDLIELIDDATLLTGNTRAIEQASAFVRIDESAADMESLVGRFLYKYVLPTSERRRVLAMLDAMQINHRAMFRDLEAAARTAAYRVSLMEAGQ